VTLDGLDTLHKDVLTVIALVGSVTSRSNWQDLVREAGITQLRMGHQRGVHGEEFKRVTTKLVNDGFVVQDRAAFEIDDIWVVPVLADAATRRKLTEIAALSPRQAHWTYSRSLGALGELRLALARGDAAGISNAILNIHRRFGWNETGVVDAIGLHPSQAWLDVIPEPTKSDYVRKALHTAFISGLGTSDALLKVGALSDSGETVARAATLYALRGETAHALALVADGDDAWRAGARGFVLLTARRWNEARQAFRIASTRGKRSREMPSYLAAFGWLMLVTDEAEPDVPSLPQRIQRANRQLREWRVSAYVLESLAVERVTGRADPAPAWRSGSWIDAIISSLAPTPLDDRNVFAALEAHARRGGYGWLEREAGALARGEKSSLVALKTTRATWERALDALAKVATPPENTVTAAPSDGVLFWRIDLHPWGVEVSAHVVSGRARVGKALSMGRLLGNAPIQIDERDRRIAAALEARPSWRVSHPEYEMLLLFADHPRLRDGYGTPIAVVRREASVRVEETKHGMHIKLDPERFEHGRVAVTRDKHVISVVELTPAVERVRAVLGDEGLVVPREGASRAAEILASLASTIAVHAPNAASRERPGDSNIHVQLFRVGMSLRARIRVRPAGPSGVALKAGVPPEVIAVHDAAGLSSVRRDLEAERTRVAGLLEQCPLFASLPMEGDDRLAVDPAACLELLLELRDAGATIEWPEGKALRIPSVVRDGKSVRVRIAAGTSWLEVQGDVAIDEGRVVAMSELVAGMSRAKGRFVPIGEDDYVALTEDLRNRLESLGRIQALGPSGRLSTAVLPAIDSLTAGFDVELTAQAERARDALREAEELSVKVPRGFGEVLRDYQRDGFVFLARRAEARMGACLADDMGLGKTVQALALLAHRGSRGPALVVCPTSVCRNWEDEAARFAPGLRFRRLHEGDRQELVARASANDVVVASYGLLVSEESLLSSRTWSTVIFDEAHALKNASTRRWAAATKLSRDATVGLTGTPLENHAGELHAIFDVLAPGLLGSRTAFDRVFGAALAEGQREAAAALRQLVRPLLLRRTKSQVLRELPPKTEMTRLIEPSADHRAFYEALRRRAFEQATNARHARGGRGRIEILAELMRLRRAAIDPRLVGGEDAPEGPKIEALGRLLVDLRDEGHRALVFSQFLEVLDLAETKLAELGVSTLRLDGSMGADERATQVAAFQSGRADAFLLSLKAGGVGMNLTAADYVIHLDPWWNPAVEDQATDRAHRIGQTRPITIIRLVTERTIEEKVLALHDRKRKLYEDVVSAADGAGTLDVELLVQLLGEVPIPASSKLHDPFATL
jgi:superfamily II DNA or RNA helicase